MLRWDSPGRSLMAESQQPPQCAAISWLLKMIFSMALKVIYANCRKSGKLKRKKECKPPGVCDSPHGCGRSSGLLLLWESQQRGSTGPRRPQSVLKAGHLAGAPRPPLLRPEADLAACKTAAHRASSVMLSGGSPPSLAPAGPAAPSSLEPDREAESPFRLPVLLQERIETEVAVTGGLPTMVACRLSLYTCMSNIMST